MSKITSPDIASSVDKARWYYDQLIRYAAVEINGPWTVAFSALETLLTRAELIVLRAPR